MFDFRKHATPQKTPGFTSLWLNQPPMQEGLSSLIPSFLLDQGLKFQTWMRQKKTLHTSTSEARNKDSRCSQYMPDPHTTHRVAPELENLQPDHKVGHHNLRGFDGCKLAGYLNCWFVRGCLVGTTKWGPEHPKTVTACYTSMGTSYSKLI